MRRCFLLLSFVSLACWQGVCGNAADLRFLEDLVRIPSVSADITNVNRAVDFAKTELERRGLFCSVETNEAGRKMLYAANIEDRKPDVVFACHLDVVSAQDPAQYEPRVSGGWLSGRGAADSKCHVVLAARVMEDLKGKVSVGALFATDEEMGGSTTRELINRGYGGKRLALVADAQPYTLTVWQKGLADYVIRVRKPAVHQGVHAGPLPNAIVDLMNGYRQLSERLPEYEDGSWREMFTCMEIGGVRDNAFLRLRVRPTRVEDWPRLERWIGECFAGGTVTCTRKGDPVYVDEKAPLVADFFAAMQARWPGKCTWRHNNSSNDSRHVQYLGLPMLIFGVETVGMHAADERVRLESIDEWAELLEAFLTKHSRVLDVNIRKEAE